MRSFVGHLRELGGHERDRGVGGAVGGHRGLRRGRRMPLGRPAADGRRPIGCRPGAEPTPNPPGDYRMVWGHVPTAGPCPRRPKEIVRTLGWRKMGPRYPWSWLLRGLAARLGLCALAASVAVSSALTLLALRRLGGSLAGGPIDFATLSRWAWTTDLVIVLATRASPTRSRSGGCGRCSTSPRRPAASPSARGVRVDPDDRWASCGRSPCSFNHMASRLDETHRLLERRNRELTRANEVLEQLSATDGLTQLYNHRHFQAPVLARGEARRADRGTALPAAGRRRRLQAAERPARPRAGDARAPGDRARDVRRRSARPTTSRATAARSSCCCCRRPSSRAARALAEKVRGAHRGARAAGDRPGAAACRSPSRSASRSTHGPRGDLRRRGPRALRGQGRRQGLRRGPRAKAGLAAGPRQQL